MQQHTSLVVTADQAVGRHAHAVDGGPSLPLRLSFVGIATLGWTGVRPVTWFNLSDGFFLLAGVIVLFRLLEGRKSGLAPAAVRRSPALLIQFAVLLLLAGALSSFGAWDPGASLGHIVRLAYLTIFWFWTLRAVCPAYDAFLYLMRGWKWMVVLTALSGFYGQYLGGESYAEQGRQIGFGEHPNAFGAALSIGLPIVLLLPSTHLNSSKPTRLENVGRAIVTVLAAVMLLQSGSISSAVAAGVGIAAALACRAATMRRNHATTQRRTAVVRLGPLLVVFLTVLSITFILSTNSPVVSRWSEVTEEGSRANRGSVDLRAEMNDYAISSIDRRLIVGIGLDDESNTQSLPENLRHRGVSIHNLYLRTLHESGLLGAIALLGMNLFAAFQALRLAAWFDNPVLRRLATALVGALVAANVGAQFQPIGLVRYYWLPVAMIACLWNLARANGRSSQLVNSSPIRQT